MRIAILGTRGIPNNYGGFEQFAEYLGIGLADAGHEVYVYCGSDHPFREKIYRGVNLIHITNPEKRTGTWGQFIYDLLCILDSRSRKFDLIYQLGYTSSSVWGRLLPGRALVLTNMDGLEWKRTKYSPKVRRFLRYAERLAVKTSDHLVADSVGIQAYIRETYGSDSKYIPYGTNLFEAPDPAVLSRYGLESYRYSMLIARMEPENNISTILEGVKRSESPDPFLVIGSTENRYGAELVKNFSGDKRIRFLGSEYEMTILNNLRYHAKLYFHGHSVGGTNPSLLEAIGSQAMVCAHQNQFNWHILGEDALYFETPGDVTAILDTPISQETRCAFRKKNLDKVKTLYLWPNIVSQYENYFEGLLASGSDSKR